MKFRKSRDLRMALEKIQYVGIRTRYVLPEFEVSPINTFLDKKNPKEKLLFGEEPYFLSLCNYKIK